jgi:hypothetical protein
MAEFEMGAEDEFVGGSTAADLPPSLVTDAERSDGVLDDSFILSHGKRNRRRAP